jgi:predicted RNA binding protein YcfA (HicA-like mRNA interferase family)
MPRLRRLTGSEVIKILEEFGFVVTRIKGSHYRLKLALDDKTCYTSVPVHGSKALPPGTLSAVYRQAAACIPEDNLRPHFYTD